MPSFEYIAVTHLGVEVRGHTDAADARTAAATLRDQSLFVVKLRTAGRRVAAPNSATDVVKRPDAGGLTSVLPVVSSDHVMFLRQLSLMLRSGLTLLQSLEVCASQTSKTAFVRAINQLALTVQSGKSLSDAMHEQGRRFSLLTVQLVRCAEATGELDAALDRAALQIERHAELRSQTVTSLIYPTIVVMTSIAVAAMLVIKVIPKFAAFFARRGGQLPWATQWLLDAAALLSKWWPAVLAITTIVAAALIAGYVMPRGRLLIHHALLRVPLIGKLLTAGLMSRFSQTLATLLESGVTIVEALSISRDVVGNRAVSQALKNAEQRVLAGHNLATALNGSVVPTLIVQAIAIGEQTGSLGQVLSEVSVYYDALLEKNIRRMNALIEPLMILSIGLMVGFVYFAFFQAVMQLSTSAR